MRDRKIKETSVKECPYCHSKDVYPTGGAQGQFSASIEGYLSYQYQFQCAKCDETFIYTRGKRLVI